MGLEELGEQMKKFKVAYEQSAIQYNNIVDAFSALTQGSESHKNEHNKLRAIIDQQRKEYAALASRKQYQDSIMTRFKRERATQRSRILSLEKQVVDLGGVVKTGIILDEMEVLVSCSDIGKGTPYKDLQQFLYKMRVKASKERLSKGKLAIKKVHIKKTARTRTAMSKEVKGTKRGKTEGKSKEAMENVRPGDEMVQAEEVVSIVEEQNSA